MASNQEPENLLDGPSEATQGVRVLSPSPGVKRRSLRNRRSEAMGDLPPAMRVRFILGEDADKPGQNEPHPVFSEMEEFKSEDGTDGEWKETARWIKFEEDVEDGGNRWTKPFVGTLSLHALFELRSSLLNGTLLLDAEATSVSEVIDAIVNQVASTHQLTADQKNQMTEVMMCPHRHLYEVQKSAPLLLSEKHRNQSAKSLTESKSRVGMSGLPSVPSMTNAANAAADNRKGNSPFLKKIPPGAEVNNVLVGEVDFLDKPVSAFVRLSKAVVLGDFAEVRLPSRFFFLLLGPKGQLEDYREVGRVVATLMCDEVFNAVAYRAKNRDHLLAGIDEFMDAVTILPPGEWDPSIRIEPPSKVPSQEPRKNPDKPPEEKEDPAVEELKTLESQGLVRTGRLFGGLIDDIKRKAPWYKSDFTDAFAVQSIASITFLYFASLSPIITFGGLLGDATENRLAALESLCAGCLCGIIYSLFAGQPLALLNATGPVLVFEGILYSFCSKYGYDYLSLRLWVGVWMGVFMVTLCAFEISAWVAYITRFTEENFALLIATIYVYKAIEKIIYIGKDYPLFPPEPKLNATDCYCYPNNDTVAQGNMGPYNWTGLPTNSCSELWNGTLMGEDCFPKEWYPNVFLMSVLLSVFTYSCCVTLKGMKHTLYFPYKVRSLISDFAVFIAICSMTGLDYYAGVRTPKLYVPSEFKPTWEGRGWYVNPIHPDNPWWIIPAAMLPAALATILLFLDQQITAVIVNRKENKLKKGCGYHLDLFVLAFLTALMGILGLPWHVAGTVICINHINSLKQESETAAPGDKPVFLGVREQRVTHLVIFLLVGLSVFMTPILKFIPMPVLYGVFLYMGTAPLAEMHFFDRLRIVFMPAKYQPDFPYLRKVPLKRVHMFTAVQLVCFAILWVVKTNETISISFPLMLVIMIFIRKCLDFIFTREELHVLDSVIPPFRRKKVDTSAEAASKGHATNGKGQIYAALPKNSSKVNISDEVVKSGVWRHVNSKTAFQDCSGTEMTSYRRKEQADSDDETEPLTFLSGGKQIQVQPSKRN